MKNLARYIILLICTAGASVFSQNAPVSSVEHVSGDMQELTVSVTVTGFNNIGSCNLQLLYDPDIATCIAVEKGGQLPGGLASNLTVPGVITLGWYNWPGVTLPDNAVIFKFIFNRSGNGTSVIEWNENYNNLKWSDGDFTTLNDEPFEDYYIHGSVTFLATDAPVTWLTPLTGCTGTTAELPVVVNEFNNIGAFTLTLHYDEAVLSYLSFNNTSGFPDLTVDASVAGKIVAQGITTEANGVSLPDNSTLFSLSYLVMEGETSLTWFDDGASCAYNGPPPGYEVRNDVPLASFYIDGSFSSDSPPSILQQPVSSDTLDPGAGIAVFEVGASGALLSYQWQEYISSWEDIVEGGVYQGAQSAELTITNPPAGMDGYHYRCIVNGLCEPPAITDGAATLHIALTTTIFNPIHNDPATKTLFLSAFPNPSSDKFLLNILSPVDGKMDLMMYDMKGVLVYQQTVGQVLTGENKLNIEPGRLMPGIYYLKVRIFSKNLILKNNLSIVIANQ